MTQMLKSTDSYDSVALEEVAARSMITRRAAAVTVLRREAARNDDTLEEPASSREELDAWARHTFASNGFGDDGSPTGDTWAWATSHELQKAARARRAFGIGEIVVAMFVAVAEAARRVYARYRQSRVAAETYDTLRRLDDHELKDLGFDRSELASVAAEAAGRVTHTRKRARETTYRPGTTVVREPA